MSLETNGVIHNISETVQVTDKFKKREFVLKTVDGDYEQFIQFQTTQDRTYSLNFVKEGDAVTVKFNLQGKPYTNKEGVTKYFSNLNAWRIEKLNAEAPKAEAIADAPEAIEDLPF